MTRPTPTPNPATSTRPERSSTRVAHKKPLAWLPWLLLLLLLLLLAAVLLAVRAARHSGNDSPHSTVSSLSPVTSAAPTPGGGGGLGATALAALSTGALVGGGSVNAAPASASASLLTGPRDPGTAGTVLFAEGSAALDSDAQQVITAAVTSLRSAGAKSVEVVGFTDVVAGAPVNDPLSQQRADAVAAALRSQLPGVTVTSSAKGQSSPIASNDTDAGRQQNRRAAIIARG